MKKKVKRVNTINCAKKPPASKDHLTAAKIKIKKVDDKSPPEFERLFKSRLSKNIKNFFFSFVFFF